MQKYEDQGIVKAGIGFKDRIMSKPNRQELQKDFQDILEKRKERKKRSNASSSTYGKEDWLNNIWEGRLR